MGNSKTNFKLVFKVCMTFKAVNHTIPQYSTIAQKYYLYYSFLQTTPLILIGGISRSKKSVEAASKSRESLAHLPFT